MVCTYRVWAWNPCYTSILEVIYIYIYIWQGLGKEKLLLFSKDKLNCSKVTVNIFIMLQNVLLNFLFLQKSWKKMCDGASLCIIPKILPVLLELVPLSYKVWSAFCRMFASWRSLVFFFNQQNMMSSSEPDSQTVFTCTDVSEGIILWMILVTAFVHSFADCKLDATFWIGCILRLFVIKTTHCCFDKYIKTGTYNTQDNVLVIHTFYGHFH